MQVEISPDGFMNMLRNQNGGALVDELDRELIKGIEAILDHGGESSITVKFKIKRIRELDKAVNIEHDVVAKHPKEDRPKKAMFITTGNGLADQPQEQQAFDLGTPILDKPDSLGSPTQQKSNVSTIGAK